MIKVINCHLVVFFQLIKSIGWFGFSNKFKIIIKKLDTVRLYSILALSKRDSTRY